MSIQITKNNSSEVILRLVFMVGNPFISDYDLIRYIGREKAACCIIGECIIIIFSFYKLLFFLIWTDGNGGGDSTENLPILWSGERAREKTWKYPFLLQMNSISAGPGKNYFGRLQKSHIEEKCEELRALKLCIL